MVVMNSSNNILKISSSKSLKEILPPSDDRLPKRGFFFMWGHPFVNFLPMANLLGAVILGAKRNLICSPVCFNRFTNLDLHDLNRSNIKSRISD